MPGKARCLLFVQCVIYLQQHYPILFDLVQGWGGRELRQGTQRKNWIWNLQAHYWYARWPKCQAARALASHPSTAADLLNCLGQVLYFYLLYFDCSRCSEELVFCYMFVQLPAWLNPGLCIHQRLWKLLSIFHFWTKGKCNGFDWIKPLFPREHISMYLRAFLNCRK